MRWSGRSRRALAGATGVVTSMIALAAVVAGPAGAADDLDKYQGDKKNVSVTASRD